MKKFHIAVFAPGLLAIASVCSGAAGPELIEEIVAKVNGDIITSADLERAKADLRAQAEQQGLKGADLEKAIKDREQNILRDKIDNLLLVQKAAELNINVDSDVSRQIAEIQRTAGIADPEAFSKYVREQTGMAIEDYRAELKSSLLTQRVVREEISSKVIIPKEEAQKYYEEHKGDYIRQERIFLREIFLLTQGKDPAAIEKKAQNLVDRARKGERFTDLVRDNSDAESKAAGGDIGSWKRGDLDKDVEVQIWDKGRGTVTDPVKRPNGFLILRVEDQFQAGQASFEEVESEVNEKLYPPKFEPKIREYLTQLRADAFLELKEGWVDVSAAPGKETKWTDPAQLKPETITKQEVVAQARKKRLLWMMPIPGTKIE
jgi:peptidyl-prolyl cis-trans isomerase SurA